MARFVRELIIRSCTLINLDFPTSEQTLVVLGDDVLIERNLVQVPSARELGQLPNAMLDPFVPGTRARGGIQIEGSAAAVRVGGQPYLIAHRSPPPEEDRYAEASGWRRGGSTRRG